MVARISPPVKDVAFEHLCSGVPAVGRFKLRVEGADRCPICGQPSPALQAEIDAQSAKMLRDGAAPAPKEDQK